VSTKKLTQITSRSGRTEANKNTQQWLLNWAIAYSTPYLVNYGEGYANLQSKIFFVWFACCFICIAFVYFFIYETKNLTLEEVDQLYDDVKLASKSNKWEPHTTFKHRASTAQDMVPGSSEKPRREASDSDHVDPRASHHEEQKRVDNV
jgi:MFS transporter, SP family, sugar:H+ symporter